MNPLRIKIENFMKHRFSDIDCTAFNSALIVAKNKHNERESNGVGKTTIYSAIEYVLFGEVPTSTLDKVVRDGTNKCSVQLDFDVSGSSYRVKRSRSSKGKSDLDLFQWLNGRWEKISGNRIPEAERQLAEIIKLNHKAFIHSVKFAQNDLTGISSAKKGDKRKEILKEPLQLSEYTKLEKISKDKLSLVKKEIERTDASIQMLGDPSTDIEASKSEISYCETTIKSKNSTIERLTKTITEKNNELNKLKKKLNSNDFEIHDKITNLGSKSKELKSQITRANERVQKNNITIKENTDSANTLRAKKKDIELKKDDLSSKKQKDIEDIEQNLEKVSSDEVYGSKILAKLEAEYDQINESLPKNDVCSQCHQPISPEYREKFEKEIQDKLEKKFKQIEKTKINLDKCTKYKNKLKTQLEEAREFQKEKDQLKQQIKLVDSEFNLRLKNIEDAEARLFESLQEMKRVQTEHEDIIKELNKLKETAKTSSVSDVNQKIFELTDEIRTYERSVSNVRKELSEAQTRHGAAQEKFKTAEINLSKLKTLKENMKDLYKKLDVHSVVVNAFSPKGIPTFIIYTIIDEYQAEANQWLNKLRPGLEFELDKDLNIKFRVDGEERDYDQLSVGQKVYITLAEKLGLSRVIQRKLGIDIRFLLLDEVDQSLDKAGVEAFAEVVRALQDEFKIFVITHNDDLKDKFSHTILVEGEGKEGAVSSVVTSW